MKRTTRWKLGLLGSLYFSQGLPFGFFSQAMPVLLRKQGYTKEEIGLSSLLALPWALKFLWAPRVERHWLPSLGQRRSWILPLQAASVAALVGLALLPSMADLQLLMGVVLLLNLLSATQDIATDGLAVDILDPEERGHANGLQVAGYRFGMILGGGVLLILHDRLKWPGTFLAMAAMLVAASAPVAFLKEAPAPEARPDAGAKPASHFLRRRGAWGVIAVLVAYKFGDAFALGMLRPYLVDAGWELPEIGWLLGTAGFVSGLAGALAGGALVTRVGRRQSLVLFGVLQAATVAGYAWLAFLSPGREWVTVLCCGEHFAGGMATAALFTCMMDWCRPGSNATDYTVQASAVVIATGAATAVSGFSAGALGYFGHFSVATVLALLSLAVVVRFFPKEAP